MIKLLLYYGIDKLVVTAGNQESRRQLITAGLRQDQIVDYHSDDIQASSIAANNGLLFNYCIDIVGGRLSESCARLLVTNGTYVDITAFTTPEARAVLFDKGATILNISNYAYAMSGNKNYYGGQLQVIANLLASGSITPPLIHVVGTLSKTTVEKAHALIEENLSRGRKLIMQVSQTAHDKESLKTSRISGLLALYCNWHITK